mgnify:CR=1 FL=1
MSRLYELLGCEDLLGAEFEFDGRGPKYDCWGICKEVYKRAGKYLPEYLSPQDPKNINKLVDLEIEKCYKRLEVPQPPCLVLLVVIPPYAHHIGVMLDERTFIHILTKRRVTIEKLDSSLWARRVKGFYEYVGEIPCT